MSSTQALDDEIEMIWLCHKNVLFRLCWSGTLSVEQESVLRVMKLAIDAARQLVSRGSSVIRFHIYVCG